MKSLNYKRYVGAGLSIFALTIGSVGLVGCETEEVETEELEVEESPIEGEELEVEEED